ncbi:uncharacterized protein LOC109802621 [Cajanus cajan]|uniref:uncharacterized protein LOC109802621 n=1 Tax=Cajanus cajan TaxID=3821 RepID=UPI00098DC46A|nr:uncharacterized protein LOC109802621 [Cajanus cajan]
MGDFNDLLTDDDKRGTHAHPPWLLHGFRSAVTDANLIDLPLEGYKYTWVKSKGTPLQIEERLDRAMSTSSWLDIFPHCRLLNVVAARSDHSPLLLNLSGQRYTRPKRAFRFENAWLKEPTLTPLVTRNWLQAQSPDILHKLHHCATDMDAWGRKIRLHFRAAVSVVGSECCIPVAFPVILWQGEKAVAAIL